MSKKWSKDSSLRLSKICVWVVGGAAAASALAFPRLLNGIVRRRGLEIASGKVLLSISFYSLLIPAAAALWFLYRLLQNISRGQVFVEENVHCLRVISWACFLAAGICLASSAYYIPFLAVAVMAGFMGLILRVVKNVFAEAVAIKQENDYTI